MFPLLKFKLIKNYIKSLALICIFAHLAICLFAQTAPTSAEERMKKVQQRKELEKRLSLIHI